MARLDGRIAMVTGAGGGIGAAVAAAFAEEGARVAVADLDFTSAAATAEWINNSIGEKRALPIQLNVADWESVQKAVEEITAKLGTVNVLVNCAGIIRPAMLHRMGVEEWHSVIRVHLDGTFFCTRAVVGGMIEQRYGKIINVTSAAGLRGTIGQVNYATAKAGIVGFTKAAARELAGYGICVNAVSPLAKTRMTAKVLEDKKLYERNIERVPMRRFAEPEEVAGAFVFLASKDSDYVTGHVLCIDGGASM